MNNTTCVNITEYSATCYDYSANVETAALVALIVCPFSIAGCLINISSDALYYYDKRRLAFFHKCVLNIASCNLCSSIIYLIQAGIITAQQPIPPWLCYVCGFFHEFFNHTSVAFTALFALQVLLKVSFLNYLIKYEKTVIDRYWETVFALVWCYSLVLSLIPLLPTPWPYPDQVRLGHYGHFELPLCSVIGRIPSIALSSGPVICGVLLCLIFFSLAIARFLYLISGQKGSKMKLLKLFGLLSFPLSIFMLYFPLFVNSFIDNLPDAAGIYHTFALCVVGAVNAFLYYFNRKYIYGKGKETVEEDFEADGYEVL